MLYKFTDSPQQRVFFISDLHFSHKKIIEYCNRPFANVEEMDSEMIKRWNGKVRKQDIVFCLGDFCFGKDSVDPSVFLYQLNGTIHFVLGNHDRPERLAETGRISSFHQIMDISVNNQKMVLCHYPMVTWVGKEGGSWMLFGHTHNSYQAPDDRLSYNVGVEWTNYTPLSFDELTAIMKPRKEKFEQMQKERDEKEKLNG